MPRELGGKSARELHERLDDALDELPRYMAVVNQSENGWLPGDPVEGPLMVTCVTVDDVREMLRRQCFREPERTADEPERSAHLSERCEAPRET